MIRAMLFGSREGRPTELAPDQISYQIKKRRRPFIWVDIAEEPLESSERLLTDVFGFHPLAVEDALHEIHSPKVNDWQDYLYLVIRAVDLSKGTAVPLLTHEVDIFLGKNYLVTYHSKEIPALSTVWENALHHPRREQRNGSDLLYRLADQIVDDYLDAIDELDVSIEELEDRIFNQPTQDVIQELFKLKRSLLHFRRLLVPQRELFNKLARGDFALIAGNDQLLFRDVYDHLVRLHDITENLRDLVSSSLDTYLSTVSNRMNEVMKTLTIFTALFMPLTFLTGFFGMNFFQPAIQLQSWTGQAPFYITIALVVLIPLSMYYWIRRRAWL